MTSLKETGTLYNLQLGCDDLLPFLDLVNSCSWMIEHNKDQLVPAERTAPISDEIPIHSQLRNHSFKSVWGHRWSVPRAPMGTCEKTEFTTESDTPGSWAPEAATLSKPEVREEEVGQRPVPGKAGLAPFETVNKRQSGKSHPFPESSIQAGF